MSRNLLVIAIFMVLVTSSCQKKSGDTITSSASIPSQMEIVSFFGNAFNKVTSLFKGKKDSFIEIIGKNQRYSNNPDYTAFVVDSAEEITKDVIENIASGAGTLEYVAEITEDIVQEACEHLL